MYLRLLILPIKGPSSSSSSSSSTRSRTTNHFISPPSFPRDSVWFTASLQGLASVALETHCVLYFPFPLPHRPPQFGGSLTGQMCHKQLKQSVALFGRCCCCRCCCGSMTNPFVLCRAKLTWRSGRLYDEGLKSDNKRPVWFMLAAGI